MAIGPISSPATWALGTVLAPSWAQNVQDNINGWVAGTASFSGISVDGSGGLSVVTPGGLVISKQSEVRENWPIAVQTLSATNNPLADLGKRWSYIMSGTLQRCVFNNPASTYAARSFTLNSGAGAVAETACLATAYPVMYGGGNFSLFFDAQVTTKTGSGLEMHMGIGDTQLANVFANGIKFYYDYSITNWQVSVNSGSSNDTGVPAVTGTWYRFRIDGVGSALKCYINEALVYSTTSSVAAALFVSFVGRQPSGTGTGTFSVGQTNLLFTR